MICNGCGGVVGRDCYNPIECEQITVQMNTDNYIADEIIKQYEEKLSNIYNALIKSSAEMYSPVFRVQAVSLDKVKEIFRLNGFARADSELPF